MSRVIAVRSVALLSAAVLTATLVVSSIRGTLAYFSDRADHAVSLDTGEVTITQTGLAQTFGNLLPGVPQSGTFTFTNVSTAAIDVYAWIEPVATAGDFDFCTTANAPFLQVRLEQGTTLVQDWTSICNLLNTPAGSGALAPLALSQDVPTGAGPTYTLSVQLHPSAGNTFENVQNVGDRLVLYALQDLAPAPTPAGPVIGAVVTPTAALAAPPAPVDLGTEVPATAEPVPTPEPTAEPVQPTDVPTPAPTEEPPPATETPAATESPTTGDVPTLPTETGE